MEKKQEEDIKSQDDDEDCDVIELDSEIVDRFTKEIDAAISKVLKTLNKDSEGFFELLSVLLSIAASIMIDTGGKKKNFISLAKDIFQSMKEHLDSSFKENKEKNKEVNIKNKSLN